MIVILVMSGSTHGRARRSAIDSARRQYALATLSTSPAKYRLQVRLEHKQGSSSKFWEPKVSGSTLIVRFGRIGTDGQTRDTKLASPAAARAALDKLVAEKRGKGYKPAGKSAPPRPTTAVKGRAELLALATELGGAGVAKEVALAVDDREKYFERTTHELFEDAEDSDFDDDLPWLALIEALNAKGRLVEVDWKECASEVLAGLDRIGGAAAKKALKPAHAETDEQLDERYTDEALALFGKLLGAAGLALIQLDKSSDSYAIMVVAARDVARLAKTARAARFSIVHWDGKDLAALEQRRFKKDKKRQTTNPWQRLVVEDEHARGTSSAVDSILFNLRHDDDGDYLARIRAALPNAPKHDHPVIAMTLALYDERPSKVAKTTTDPRLCLYALKNVREDRDPFERLAAAAILAERLRLKPDRGKDHVQLCLACNLWAAPEDLDAALAKLPRGAWARLARLADAMLAQTRPSTELHGDGYRAIRSVGDAQSLAIIEAVAVKAKKAMAASRVGYEDGAEPWTKATKQIEARIRRAA